MIDVLNEELIDLRRAAKLPPFANGKTGKPAHIASLYRHVLNGARAANGERIRLETVRTPGGLRTSRQAVERFIRSLTNPDIPMDAPLPSQRVKQIDAAEARLVAAGF